MKHMILSLLLTTSFLISYSQSSVWTIEGNGTKIFLGGSIHLLRPQDYPLPDSYDSAYNNSEIVVTETDMTEANNPANAEKMQKAMMFQDDRSLKSVLSDSTYHSLDKVCKTNGLNISMLDKFKPSMVILLLTFQELGKLGVTNEGVDMHFTNKALADKKRFLYLESFDQQLSFIENMGEGKEDEFVMYSIRDLKESNEKFAEMIEAWKTGNSSFMAEQLAVFQNDYPDIYTTIVKQRNDNWIIQLENWLKTPEAEFVIVGALHLYGPHGVLQQMKEKGYKISQL